MDIISDRLKYDFDVYDSLPEENPGDYIQGFCYTLFIPMNMKYILRLENALNESNAIAMIPTEYRTEDSENKVYFILYVTHKSYVEHQYFVFKTQLLTYGKAYRSELTYKETSPNPVYFHKGWTRPSYDPNKYNDPVSVYKLITVRREFWNFLPDGMVSQIRREYWRTKPCYVPVEGDDTKCGVDWKGVTLMCTHCVLSKHCKNKK